MHEQNILALNTSLNEEKRKLNNLKNDLGGFQSFLTLANRY